MEGKIWKSKDVRVTNKQMGSIRCQAGWAPELVRTLWKIETFLSPAGNQTQIPRWRSCNLVTTSTELLQLNIRNYIVIM